MGLLQKATEQSSNTPIIRENKFPEIENKLKKIKDQIEFYPTLFQELVNLFSIEKGALLIRDGEVFTLSSVIGYDETTKNRLRLSVTELNTYKNSNDIYQLEHYFSIREFVMIKDLQLLKFINNEKVEGILLITEHSTQSKPLLTEMINYTKKLEKFFGDNPLNKLKTVEIQNIDIKQSVMSYLQEIKTTDNRIIIIKLNLDNLISELIDKNTLSTSSSIKTSAIKILSSFAKNRGRVFQIYNNNILLTLLDANCTTNIVVVQQQISAAFKSIFSNKLQSVDLGFESLIWKNNSLDIILDHFIQDAVN